MIEELKMLWTDDILTYEVSTGQNLCLRVKLIWIINDFPAYSMLSRLSTDGKNDFPHCMSNAKAFYLRISRNMWLFDYHQMFLPDRFFFYKVQG